MIKLLKILITLSLVFPVYASQNDPLISKVSNALIYLDEHAIDQPYEKVDINATLEAVGYISQFLDIEAGITKASSLYLKKIRAMSLIVVNRKRYFIQDGQINDPDNTAGVINKSEVRVALKDIDSVTKEAPDDGLIRDAANAALLLLENKQLTNHYYKLCANLKNVACMNVLGYDAFYGTDGAEQDPDEAIYLHTETFNTGTSWGCAGLYSARQLSDIAYFTQFDTGDSWQNWISKANAFFPKLKKRFDEELPCTGPYTLVKEYLMYLGTGVKKPELLDQALTLEPSEVLSNLITALQHTQNLNKPAEYFSQTHLESNQCSMGLYLLMFAHHTQQTDLIEIHQGNFKTLDKNDCANEYYLVEQAQLLVTE